VTIAKGAVHLVAGRQVAVAYGVWERRADRYWHRASSGLTSLLLAQALGWDLSRQVTALALGLTFGGGLLSPDVDNSGPWRAFDEAVPDRWVGSPLRHHGITHSVPLAAGTAAAAWLVLWWLGLGSLWWLWWVPLVWVMHDLGDWLIGHAYQGAAGPCWRMWWGNHGLGKFKSGGLTCRLLTVACWFGIGWLMLGGVS
jgi:LexA-binding, inner membrane-associated putative hydrolase